MGHAEHWNGWAFRILHNLVIDHYRSRGRPVDVDLPETLSTTSDELAERETQDELHRLLNLAQLTPRQYEAVTLRYLAGWPLDDIAARMGSSRDAVKMLQHRALLRLRAAAQRARQ